jgi:hypothetical protein
MINKTIDELIKTVCFLALRRTTGEDRGLIVRGTGFFVAVDSPVYKNVSHFYLVTARHCIKYAAREIEENGNGYQLAVRVNVNSVLPDSFGPGNVDVFDCTTDGWIYPEEDSVDIAIRGFGISQDYVDYLPISEKLFATNVSFRVGDSIFGVGLFTQEYGKSRNLPILRSGIIAALPTEPLEDNNSSEPYNAYLVEMRSIGGLSGTPIFVTNAELQQPHLLGIVRGHWDLNRPMPTIGYSEDENATVNSGIARITPVSELRKLLFSKELEQERTRQTEDWIRRNPEVTLEAP